MLRDKVVRWALGVIVLTLILTGCWQPLFYVLVISAISLIFERQ